MIGIIAAFCLTACSTFGEVSFNKQEQVKKQEFNKLGMQFERELKTHTQSADNKALELQTSKDLPTPNLILERGLVYTPTTRMRTRIISGGTNLPQFRSVPESEYWRGN